MGLSPLGIVVENFCCCCCFGELFFFEVFLVCFGSLVSWLVLDLFCWFVCLFWWVFLGGGGGIFFCLYLGFKAVPQERFIRS